MDATALSATVMIHAIRVRGMAASGNMCPCDGFALPLGQTEGMLGAVGCDVAVNEPVHVCNAVHAGKMAQITAEALAVPVIAEKVMQQRGTDNRGRFALRQTHQAGDLTGCFCYRNGMVIHRVVQSVVTERAKLLKTRMCKDISRVLLNFTGPSDPPSFLLIPLL